MESDQVPMDPANDLRAWRAPAGGSPPSPPTSREWQAQRAYEWGRLRRALRQASLLTAAVVLVAWWGKGTQVATWTLGIFPLWAFAAWRGRPWPRSVQLGLVAGAIAIALPPWLVPHRCVFTVWSCVSVAVLVGVASSTLVETLRRRS